ncbi:MAG: group II truncated hemoglobin [Gammaproteobacteria bacterium]
MKNTHFERLGGDQTLRQLVKCFYQLMDELPEAQDIRKLHSPDLSEAEEKLFMFLCGWLGGPQLYMEKYGHPRLRQRHMPFKIGEKERDQWMLCMNSALQQLGIAEPLLGELSAAFYKTADFMRNQ